MINKISEEAVPVFKEEVDLVFEIHEISPEIKERIYGISYKENAPVTLDELRYLRVSYYDFDENIQVGELIVNQKVASEIIEIFKELYDVKYPIDKMKLIDEYDADDNKSCIDNNTSALCVRPVVGSTINRWSNHSYGLAIDINPVQNPYVYSDGHIYDPNSKPYLDRTNIRKGMIIKDDPLHKAFTSRGWRWGGDFKNTKDYQHFDKK